MSKAGHVILYICIGIYGLSYGTSVRGRPSMTCTEWDFDAASAAGNPRQALIDRRPGNKQDAFVQRVQTCGLTVRRFLHPGDLHRGDDQALMELSVREWSKKRCGKCPAESRPLQPHKVSEAMTTGG